MEPTAIERLVYTPKEQRFKFLWLMYIEAVDLEQHCQKTFVGTKSERVQTRVVVGERAVCLHEVPLDESGAAVMYLCGVSEPYQWAKNYHLAFRRSPGSRVFERKPGIEVLIRDAEAIKIMPTSIDPTHPRARNKAFHTCRNWQFARQAYAAGLVPRSRGTVRPRNGFSGQVPLPFRAADGVEG